MPALPEFALVRSSVNAIRSLINHHSENPLLSVLHGGGHRRVWHQSGLVAPGIERGQSAKVFDSYNNGTTLN